MPKYNTTSQDRNKECKKEKYTQLMLVFFHHTYKVKMHQETYKERQANTFLLTGNLKMFIGHKD